VVTVRAAGYREASETLRLAERDRKVLPIALERDPNARVEPETDSDGRQPQPTADDAGGLSPLVWVGFGVGAAGLVAGTITGAVALSKTAKLRDTCGSTICGPQHEDDVQRAEAIAHGSTVSFALGGAGVALGLVALLWLSGGDDESGPAGAPQGAASVSPWIGVGSAGLAGRF